MKSNSLILDKVKPDHFRDHVGTAAIVLKPLLGLNLTRHPLAAYSSMDCYLVHKRTGGFAVSHDGELVNLYSFNKGQGDALVAAAIERGATHLNCYDGYLPTLYARNGFIETHRVPWDDAYAPKGWEFGKPDVVFMQVAK